MTLRYPIKCDTCGHIHTLRIGVGYNETQRHSFNCMGCNEIVEIVMELDQVNGKILDIKCIENCSPSDSEGDVINLHPDFVFSIEGRHADHSFELLSQISSFLGKKREEAGSESDIGPARVSIKGLVTEWGKLKKAWSLNLSEKYDLSDKIVESHYKGSGLDPSLHDWIFRFFSIFINKTYKAYADDVVIYTSKFKRAFPDEFRDFEAYYFTNLEKKHFANYLEIFSEYFSCYDEYSQVFIYNINDIKIPDDMRATSEDFRKTKMFYGNIYEILTSHFVIPACINNIANGRKYNEFISMDLKKYLTIDKANRGNPFKENEQFANLCKYLEPSLRNASHHGSVKYVPKKGIIEYRSGGSGALKTMTYANYLFHCNQLVLQLSVLLLLELVIQHSKRSSG